MCHKIIFMPPKVSVLMSVYNGEEYLRVAIESILNQTFSDFEYIIINDCSTDGSREIILSYNDPRIRLIDNVSNQGLTKSLNIGIDAALGEYIARMDADDISLPDRFKKQIEFLHKNPETAMVGSSAIYVDETGKELHTVNVYIPPDLILARLFFGNVFVHTSVMGKSNLFKKFKYDVSLLHAQDYYLWSQIAFENKVANIEEPLVKYRVHNQSISVSKFEKQESFVKKTFAFHLSLLNIKSISDEKLEMHYLLLRNQYNTGNTSTQQKLVLLRWLCLLKNKNQHLDIYNQKFFKEQLEIYWKLFFDVNSSFYYGIKAIPFIFDSFNENIRLKTKLIFALRCIKAEIKNEFNKTRSLQN